MRTEKENNEIFKREQFEIAKFSNNLPDIIVMKSRIENGNIDKNVISEWLKIREEINNCKAEIKEMKDNHESPYKHPTIRKFNWLMVNYIYGNIERLKLIVEHDVDSLPKDNEIFYNSVNSHEIGLEFLIEKEGMEKWKDRIEKDNLFFPELNSTKSANRALNKILSKGSIPPGIEKIFPTINIKKYDPDLIYKNLKTIFVFKSRAVFDAWFVDGVGCNTKIKCLNKDRGAPSQLKSIVSEITDITEKLVKPINLAFDLTIDSNTRITSLLPKTALLLKSCMNQ